MIDLSENNIRRIAARHSLGMADFLLAIVDLKLVPHNELPSWIYYHRVVMRYRQRNFKNHIEIENEANNSK